MKILTRTFRGSVAAALLGAGAMAGAGQPRGTPPTALAEFTGRSIARVAIFDARLPAQPTEADYRIAAILLGVAQDLLPDDAHILRRRIEASWDAGDRDVAIALTERLVALDPSDTVAQLRLITARLGVLQTAEARLAAYDRFLGPEGRALDASIRSRLALDAALLLRERGDVEGFVRRLTQSVQLDGTHKEAAALAATFAADRTDRAGRLDLLVNLLKADPVDPNVHLSLSRELAAGGAFEGARRFLSVARQIFVASGLAVDRLDQQAMVMRWLSEGPRAVVQAINRDRVERARDVARRLEAARAAGMPLAGMERPEDVRVAVPYAVMQIMALDATGERTAVEAAVAEMAQTVQSLVTNLLDPTKRPLDMNQAQAEVQVAVMSAQLQLARLWTGTEVEQADRALAPDGPLAQTAPGVHRTLASWQKLRSDDPQGALEEFSARRDEEGTARAGIVLALEALGRRDEAIEEMRTLVRDVPMTTAGAWAWSRLEAMGLGPTARESAALEEYARTIPEWVDRMIERPRDFIGVKLNLEQLTVDALDRNRLQLSIQNIAPIPLAVGSDRAINSRLLLALKLESVDAEKSPLLRPEIVDANRRLRLLPRETLTMEVWPDAGESGYLLEMLAGFNMRARWRLIQGFWINPGGGYMPGPLCVTTETDALVRRPLPEASLNVEEFVRKIAGDPENLLPRIAGATRAALLTRPIRPDAGADAGDDRPAEPIAAALAARYPSLSPVARAMLVAVIPHQRLAPSMKAFDEALKAETDPFVQAVVLVTRVTDPDDSMLAAALASEDARLKLLAEQIAVRLTGDQRFFAKLEITHLRPSDTAETSR